MGRQRDDVDDDYDDRPRRRDDEEGDRDYDRVPARLPSKQEFASKKVAAGVCGILLGGFGVHKFILGLSTPGVIMLLVSLLGTIGGFTGFFCLFTLPLFIGPMVMGTIGFVEGIMYLTKSDDEFYRRYAVEKQGWF